MSLKFKLKTLGCKVNQSESAMIAAGLREIGLSEAGANEPARMVVINTCTVTSKSDYESRQIIRRAARENPGAHIVVTGCYAETGREEICGLEEDVRIVPNQRKLDIKEYIIFNSISSRLNSINNESMLSRPLEPLRNRSRAFLKIQDGCDNRCTYCAVWRARGPSRSTRKAEILSAIRALEAGGMAEVVLAGIHVGFWGKDSGEGNLSGLLKDILAHTVRIRVRVSSIEPGEVDLEFQSLMANEERLCRHLHIPLQAADDRILERMGRGYGVQAYFELLHRLSDRVPGICLGTDVITGFPGETKQAFERSSKILEASPLAYLHVFPFSRRRGTVASELPEQVTAKEIKQRARKLREISDQLRKLFLESQDGKDLHVVYEGLTHNGMELKCISDNYIRFNVPRMHATSQAEGQAVFTFRNIGAMGNV